MWSHLNSAWHIVSPQKMVTVVRTFPLSAKAPGMEFAQEISKAGCSVNGIWRGRG